MFVLLTTYEPYDFKSFVKLVSDPDFAINRVLASHYYAGDMERYRNEFPAQMLIRTDDETRAHVLEYFLDDARNDDVIYVTEGNNATELLSDMMKLRLRLGRSINFEQLWLTTHAAKTGQMFQATIEDCAEYMGRPTAIHCVTFDETESAFAYAYYEQQATAFRQMLSAKLNF